MGDGVWRHTWETAVSGVGVLAAGTVGVFAVTVRYALRQFDARTRAQLREVTDLQRTGDLEMQRREHELERREEALRRARTTMSLRLASYAKALDDARNAAGYLRAQVCELQQEIVEVNDERNQLIVEELVQSREAFTSKGYGRLRVAGSKGPATGIGHRRSRDATPLIPEREGQLRKIDTP